MQSQSANNDIILSVYHLSLYQKRHLKFLLVINVIFDILTILIILAGVIAGG